MTVGSDNPFPSVLFAEHVDPSNPGAGTQRLFVDTDHILKLIDSSGTVTTYTGASGAMATDALWDAAGDLAVGTGANTGAKLSIGAAGGAVSRVNGAVAWNSGTSFPTAATGDRYYRTDVLGGIECTYDGTRWLGPLQRNPFSVATQGNPITGTNNVGYLADYSTAFDMWLIALDVTTYVLTTNNGTDFWTIAFRKQDVTGSATTIVSYTTAAHTASNWTHVRTLIGAAYVGSAHKIMDLTATKSASAGSLYCTGAVEYRLIIT